MAVKQFAQPRNMTEVRRFQRMYSKQFGQRCDVCEENSLGIIYITPVEESWLMNT